MGIGNLMKAIRISPHRLFFILFLFFVISFLILFLSVQNAYAMDITFAWDEVLDENLAGYRLFYREEGQQSYNYTAPDWQGTDNTCTIYNLDANTSYYFVVRAYDPNDNESDNSNEVNYSPTGNMPPNADAGTIQTVNETETVTLDGSNSNDPDGSITAYLWTQTAGLPVTLSDPNSVQPTFSAPYVGSGGGSLIFQLIVTDNGGSQSTDSCTVNVSDSIPNLAPLKPVINSPSDGTTGCELMPQITTAIYSDPENDSHIQSHWQVSKQQDFSSPVLDTDSNEHLTELTVPHLVLEPNTTYYCRVQFSDAFSATSEWSDPIGFTTKPVTNDSNADGIPDIKKIPDDVDLNEDGTYDNDQPNVIKCITLPDNVTFVGINKASNSITSIEALDTIDPATISDTANRPSGLSFGLFSYRLQLDQPGATASVRIYFSEDISQATNFYKYDTVNGWQDCTQNVTFNGDGRSITITIEDGGFGDSDGVANGIIVDPGGLVSFNGSAGTFDNGATSTGGCFISTLGGFTSQSVEHDQNP